MQQTALRRVEQLLDLFSQNRHQRVRMTGGGVVCAVPLHQSKVNFNNILPFVAVSSTWSLSLTLHRQICALTIVRYLSLGTGLLAAYSHRCGHVNSSSLKCILYLILMFILIFKETEYLQRSGPCGVLSHLNC